MSVMLKVETVNGSTYIIDEDERFWRKNDGQWERLWWHYSVPIAAVDFSTAEKEEHLPLTVGLRLYIGSRNVWWLTSTIEAITEIEISR